MDVICDSIQEADDNVRLWDMEYEALFNYRTKKLKNIFLWKDWDLLISITKASPVPALRFSNKRKESYKIEWSEEELQHHCQDQALVHSSSPLQKSFWEHSALGTLSKQMKRVEHPPCGRRSPCMATPTW